MSAGAIGQRLRQVRGQSAQGEFAGLLGIGRTSLLRYESGQRELGAALLIRLNELIGVEPTWLLLGKGGPGCGPARPMKPRFRYDHRRGQWHPVPARKGLGPSNQEAARERFVRQLNRLKAVLGVVEDQHVAVVLGMSKAAFSARKMRGAFPTNHVKALAIDAPDLHIDVDYVLGRRPTQERTSTRAVHTRIVAIRKGLGLNQAELAGAMGVNLDRVKSLSSGRIAKFSQAEMRMLVDRLHVRSHYLVTGEPPIFDTEAA